jgi:hypothetical protein
MVALILLISGPFLRYFPLFLFLVSLLVTAVAETWVIRVAGVTDNLYFNVYWGGEFLLDALMFFLVISLTARALEGNPMRSKTLTVLFVIVGVAILVPFVAFDSTIFGRRWNQSVGQLLNFGVALMNLVLWSALLLARQKDRQLLTVSAGLGVTVAAAALTLGVRQFTNQDDVLRVTVDWVHRLSQCVGPAMWCWAFRPSKPRLAAPSVDVTASAT